MAEVLAIELASFPADSAWCEEEFIKTLRQRNHIGMVAEHEDQIVGYVVYGFDRCQIQLKNLAVHPERRRQFVGRQLVDYLQRKLSPNRRRRIVANVRETNVPAQLFFRACCLTAVGVLRGSRGAWEVGDNLPAGYDEDAYQFEISVDDPLFQRVALIQALRRGQRGLPEIY